MPTRLFSGLSRLTLVVALLILTLGVAIALAWQAHEAARSHEAVARRVQQDYVEFAGWQFARAARQELTSRFDRWLQATACAASGNSLPPPNGLGRASGCRCDDLAIRSLFRVDLSTEALEVSGEPLGAEATKWILGTLRGDRRVPPTRHAYLLSVGTIDGRPRLLGVTYGRDRFGAPVMLAGFAADPMALAPAFTHVIDHAPLLPPTLTGKRDSDLVRAFVSARDGTPLFGTGTPPDWIRADGALEASLDGLRYQVALNPERAAGLVIGGLPKSRLPLLLGLLTLTAGLLAVAVQQLRREHDLTRLRADFVASVSHELRTPLAQIRLFSETLLLRRVRSGAEAQRSLEIIQQESRRLTHLVENVLYFSRGERGAQRLALTPTRLAPVIEELLEAFGPLAHSGRSTIHLRIHHDVMAPIDSEALRQIVLNLLDNAVKYGGPGQNIAVGLDRRDERAILTVDDQGPGVAREIRTRIWDPYWRQTSAASSAVAGTGIGLAVVRDLVRLHGGTIRVEDAPGGGARFVIEFPDATAGAASEPAAAARVPA